MASNTTLNSGTGGDVITTKERTHDGDATKTQVVNVAGVTGTEGSYTHTDVAAGGGVEAAALRVTIASDSTGVVSVDDNGSSLTIDGTVTAVGAAAEDAAASGNPVLVGGRYDSSARTLETGDAGAIALNASGQVLVEIAAGAGSGGTSAADDADFTAGTTSGTPVMGVYESTPTSVTDGDLGTVGITQTRALKVAIASGGVAGIAEDSAAAGGEEGIMILAVRRDSAASSSGTDGDFSTLNTDSTGRLWCNVSNTVTVASHAVTNAGTFATQVDGAALTALQLIDNACLADDAAFTPASSGVHVAGFFADETATDSVDEGDTGAARMTLDRKVITTSYVHAAAGGATPHQNLDVDESEDDIKTSPGKLFWVHAINLANAKRYIKFYNATAANVTVGSTTPVLTFPPPTPSPGGSWASLDPFVYLGCCSRP